MHTKSTYLWQCHVSWRTLQRVPEVAPGMRLRTSALSSRCGQGNLQLKLFDLDIFAFLHASLATHCSDSSCATWGRKTSGVRVVSAPRSGALGHRSGGCPTMCLRKIVSVNCLPAHVTLDLRTTHTKCATKCFQGDLLQDNKGLAIPVIFCADATSLWQTAATRCDVFVAARKAH